MITLLLNLSINSTAHLCGASPDRSKLRIDHPAPLFVCGQVWESVPFLVSYQSPVLREEEPIPASPVKLTLTWNGKRGGGGLCGYWLAHD